MEIIHRKMSSPSQYAVVVINVEEAKKAAPGSLVKDVFLFADHNGAVLKTDADLLKFDQAAGYRIEKMKNVCKVYQLKRTPGLLYSSKIEEHVLTYEIIAVSSK